jgi:hypothetical protein
MKSWQAILVTLALFAVSSYVYFKSPGRLLWLYLDLIYLAMATAPIMLAVAWWRWRRRVSPRRGWRDRILLSGLVAASCNIILFGVVVFLRSKNGYGFHNFWKIDDACSTAGCCLLFWGLLGGEASGERGLIPVALRANFCLGLLLWIPIGVL